MSQAILTSRSSAAIDSPSFLYSPVYQAYRLLHVAFVVAPIVAGLDKFFRILVDWDQYLAPIVPRVLGGHGHQFMLAVGVIEIVAGLGVLLKPKIFAYVVAAWLLGIIGQPVVDPRLLRHCTSRFGTLPGRPRLGPIKCRV